MREAEQRLGREKRSVVVRLVSSVVVVGVLLFWLMRSLGYAPVVAAVLAATAALPPLAASLTFARVAWSGWYPGPTGLRILAVVWAVSPATTGAAIAFKLFDLSGRLALVLAAGLLVGFASWYQHQTLNSNRQQVQRPIELRDWKQADRMIQDCRAALGDPSLGVDHRAVVELNLARALIARSLLAGRHDGLVEATTLIEQVFRNPPPQPELLMLAARDLVAVMSVKAQKLGDLDGYQEAVRLQVDMAERWPDIPGALANAYDDEADLHLLLAGRPSEDDQEAARQLDLVLQRTHDAMRALPEGSPLLPMLHGKLAYLLQAVDPDEAVRHGRTAQRLAARRPAWERATVGLGLANALAGRAEDGGPSAVDDLDEAVELCRFAIRRGSPDMRGVATEALTDVLVARASVLRDRGGDDTAVAAAFRQAHEAARRLALPTASRVATVWAEWAVERGQTREAADAYWHLVSAIPGETANRILRPDKERAVAATQGVAAEAGYWLLRAGRAREAAVAIELGRAVLLTNTVQRERLGLEALLAEAGRLDLYHRYRSATAQLDEAERLEQLGPATPSRARPLHFQGRSYHAAFTSALQEAWAAYDEVAHEIGRMLGLDLATAPRYEDLQAAARHGPLVYLAAAEAGGFALVVDQDRDPRPIWLSELTTSTLRHRAGAFLAGPSGPREWWRPTLDETLDWLWSAVMAEVVKVVAPELSVTLVPVGALSLLPLHAARHRAGPDGAWRYAGDQSELRYAPNARVLQRAQGIAEQLGNHQFQVLAVDASRTDGHKELSHATRETRDIERLLDGTCQVLSDATADEVLGALPAFTTWHFACHGRAVVERPLDSALLLADRPLRLRDLIARPGGRQRMAVLSGCETSVPGTELLDEVVGLPSGLLQVGVAGVVGSQWRVGDRAARLLVLRFYRLWRDGLEPARALIEAQAWLRSLSNEQLHGLEPGQYPRPAGLPAEALAAWAAQCPFQHPDNWAAFSYTGA
jgi:CHAT domain-containing protein